MKIKDKKSSSKHFHINDIPKKNFNKLRPCFSLENLIKGYCFSDCEKEEKLAFINTIFKLSQLSWEQISQLPRHGLGFEKISRNSLKFKIPEFVTDDCDIFAFRFYGKAPMIGYRIEQIFYILCLDRSFTAYDH